MESGRQRRHQRPAVVKGRSFGACLAVIAACLAGGCSPPWVPGLEREVACEGQEPVPWTPWLHSFLGSAEFTDDVDCNEDPYVEFFDSKQELASSFEEWGWYPQLVTDMFIDFETDVSHRQACMIRW